MATFKEKQQELDTKRGELKAFLDERQTDAGLNFKGEDIKAFNDRNDEINRIFDESEELRKVEEVSVKNAEALAYANTPTGRPAMPNAAMNGAVDEKSALRMMQNGGQAARKSLGEQFTESAQFKGAKGDSKPQFSVDVQGVTLKDLLSTTAGVSPYPMQQADIVPFANRRLTVADLMMQVNTDVPAIVFLEQTTQTNNAAPIAEGATKPESALAWTRRTIPMEVIGHTLPVTNQELEDIPGIRSIIDEELTYLLKLAEEVQILNGNGTSPQLTGISTRTGVQTQAKGTDDIFTAAMKAFTLVRFTGFADVSAGVLHPNDWLAYVTAQDTTGRFIYGDPSQAVEPRIWGVPIVVTPAQTENTGLFGDYRLYARLWRKGGIRIDVGLVNDQFIKNEQTIRCEERAALQVRRPSAFVKLTGI